HRHIAIETMQNAILCFAHRMLPLLLMIEVRLVAGQGLQVRRRDITPFTFRSKMRGACRKVSSGRAALIHIKARLPMRIIN
ncbi:hypothetical protein, partial [Serratia marcescens]|uniref:hypothetical protein n=1 Tax=Serratia marcescens TaxID=615 RepID=UPI0013D9BEDB